MRVAQAAGKSCLSLDRSYAMPIWPQFAKHSAIPIEMIQAKPFRRALLILAVGVGAAGSLFGASQCVSRAYGNTNDDCGDIQLGRPKLWSLADAQYLVGQALQKLRDLQVELPEKGVINPNKVHGRELEVVTQLFGVNAGYDQAVGAKNAAALENHAFKQQRAAQAREEMGAIDVRLAAARTEKETVDGTLATLSASKTALDTRIAEISTEITAIENPPVPDGATLSPKPTPEDVARLAQLRAQRAALQDERLTIETALADATGKQTQLAAEISNLNARRSVLDALVDPGEPGVTIPAPKAVTADETVLDRLMKQDGVKEAVGKRLVQILDSDATLHYVHELDNLVDAQLQIISRRLTLLRQSVDPDYDLYFMETTASLTPTRKTRHHVARARWRVTAEEIDYDAILSLYEIDKPGAGQGGLRDASPAHAYVGCNDIQDAQDGRCDAFFAELVSEAELTREEKALQTELDRLNSQNGDATLIEQVKTVLQRVKAILLRQKYNEAKWELDLVTVDLETTELTLRELRSELGIAEQEHLRKTTRKDRNPGSRPCEGAGNDAAADECVHIRELREYLAAEDARAAELRSREADLDSKRKELAEQLPPSPVGAMEKLEAIRQRATSLLEARRRSVKFEDHLRRGCQHVQKHEDQYLSDEARSWSGNLVEECRSADLLWFSPETLEARAAAAIGAIVSEEGERRDLSVLDPSRTPYIFEMTPQQSELNIARNQALSKQLRLGGVFKWLFGLGISGHFERQKDRYGQFLEQRVFMAGFGKGNAKFGWDYGPMPGEDWVAPGAYTTYGVLAVPKYRRSLKFRVCSSWMLKPQKASGFPRQRVPEEECFDPEDENKIQGSKRTYHEMQVDLPHTTDYWVTSMYYKGVKAGEDISIIIRGRGFTPESSVLVNNIPLEPRWRLVDPQTSGVSYLPDAELKTGKDAPDPSVNSKLGNGSNEVSGHFEVISSDTIVLRFTAGDEFVGVPQITLVSPHKSVHLYRLRMEINGRTTSLRKVDEDYQAGTDDFGIFFYPKSGWPGISGVRFAHVGSDARPKTVSAIFDIVGMDLQDDAEDNTSRIAVQVASEGGEFRYIQDDRYCCQPRQARRRCTVDLMPRQRKLMLRNCQVSDSRLTLKIERWDGKYVDDLEACRLLAKDPCKITSQLVHIEEIPFRPKLKAEPDPAHGPAKGGNTVELNGQNLGAVSQVFFGSTPVAVESVSDNTLTIKAPKGKAGTKVKIRAVSRLKLDGKEVSSVESKTYSYDKPAGRSKARIDSIAFDNPISAQQKASGVTVKVSGLKDLNDMTVVVSAGGSAVALAPGVAYAVSGGDTLRLQPIGMTGELYSIYIAKGGEETSKSIPVPHVPQVSSLASAGGRLILVTGLHLQHVTSVSFSVGGKTAVQSAVLTPLSTSFVVELPDGVNSGDVATLSLKSSLKAGGIAVTGGYHGIIPK